MDYKLGTYLIMFRLKEQYVYYNNLARLIIKKLIS